MCVWHEVYGMDVFNMHTGWKSWLTCVIVSSLYEFWYMSRDMCKRVRSRFYIDWTHEVSMWDTLIFVEWIVEYGFVNTVAL